MQKIRIELDESKSDYESKTAQKTHSDLLVRIQATNNDSSQSIRFIARDIGVSYQAWSHLVFLQQEEKGPIFITGHEGLHCKSFEPTQASIPTEHVLVFLRYENFIGIRLWIYRTTIGLLYPHKI